ncbi:MAG: acetyl-CoA acetyltransferase [Pseudomonadales bacterium]
MNETPVLVGISQLEQRLEQSGSEPPGGKEPVELMIDAVVAAAEDAGCPRLLQAASSIRVIRGLWPYKNPAKAVGEAIDNTTAETCLTPWGGNFVQTTLNSSALEIQSGRNDVIIITGAECGNTQAKARRAGLNARKDLNWRSIEGSPDRLIGVEQAMAHPAEIALGLLQPIQMYPMFENALRHHLGESIDDHIRRVSELWAGFSRVAADNPHAWIREAKTAEEIRTVSDVNRPVSLPYPKFMNSNNNVDQAAALIMCSASTARKLGIAREKMIYPWSGADAHDHYFVSNRDNFHSSPAIRFAGARALEMAGLTVHDLAHVDLYSCFPVAVQVAARELGIDMSRPLTVTGGLTFAGGPLNNYVMHSIARMAQLLRAAPAEKGLITANGGYLTKHAIGIYSAEPPAKPFQHADLQPAVDATPAREIIADYHGEATVESYTVMYAGEGPRTAYLSALTDEGQRVWATCEDPQVHDAMACEEFCGRRTRIVKNLANF